MFSKNKKTALIVEDSPTQRLCLELLLDENGLDIISARDGEEGLRKAQLYLPDIIVLDIELPGINGFQVCKLLKENRHTRHIPIVLLTAMQMEPAQLGSRSGEIMHIPKDERSDERLLTALLSKGFIQETYL